MKFFVREGPEIKQLKESPQRLAEPVMQNGYKAGDSCFRPDHKESWLYLKNNKFCCVRCVVGDLAKGA